MGTAISWFSMHFKEPKEEKMTSVSPVQKEERHEMNLFQDQSSSDSKFAQRAAFG